MTEDIQIIKAKCIALNTKTSKNGKQYFELETDNGAITFFDGGIADLINKKGAIGKTCELGLKENKGYQNLYSVEKVFDGFQTADKSFYQATGIKEPKQWGRTQEEKDSIVAQCIVKIAAELTRGQMEVASSKNNIIEMETEMLNNTKMALDCYKKVLEELKHE